MSFKVVKMKSYQTNYKFDSDGTQQKVGIDLTRRLFIQYSVAQIVLSYSGLSLAESQEDVVRYPIDAYVPTTVDRMLAFPMPPLVGQQNSGKGLSKTELYRVDQYARYGYGSYWYGPGLPIEKRFDLMPKDYNKHGPLPLKQLSSFFTVSDIHLTDKQAGNQLIGIQQINSKFGASMTSIYSPTMLTTTQVFDAAIQTVNALHKSTPFDFGLSLGDTCNSTQYNETRWYIDILDGKVIHPNTSGDRTQDNISFQRPFKAAGLLPEIPWYQINGNHDLFMIGSVSVDADPSLKLRNSYVSDQIWAIGDILDPIKGFPFFPALFDTSSGFRSPRYYMGTINGSSENGEIIGVGPIEEFASPPYNPPNPERRSLNKREWISEFFNTSTLPRGHGFGLIDPDYAKEESGFSCYSFLPKPNIPLRMVVLDDVQDPNDGSHDIHGHGYLSATRLKWLREQLSLAKQKDELVIIASHVPLAVTPIGSEMEWWESSCDPHATMGNAINLSNLISEIQSNGQVLCWLAGHRHVNTIKAFQARPGAPLEQGFWQIETSSLHDFPQQFRTISICLNRDYSISIIAINVDPAVAAGTPAEKGRQMAIAAQQIIQNDMRPNEPNLQKAYGQIPVAPMDPTRRQDGTKDPSIRYGEVPGVPYCASYNAELLKLLSPRMIAVLKKRFPQ